MSELTSLKVDVGDPLGLLSDGSHCKHVVTEPDGSRWVALEEHLAVVRQHRRRIAELEKCVGESLNEDLDRLFKERSAQ